MSRSAVFVSLIAVLAPVSVLAEDVPAPGERGAQVIVTDPNYGQPSNQPVQVVEETSPAEQGRGLEYGGSLFVPIWIGDIGDYFYPGLGIDLRAGWELGRGLSIDGHLGFLFNAIRPAYSYYEDDSLQGAYLGVGLRYAFLNRSAIVPFVQAGLQLNIWSVCYDATCKSSFDTFNFGAYAGGGLIYEVNAFASVDFGLNLMTTLGDDGGFFEGLETSVQPFVGVTLYY